MSLLLQFLSSLLPAERSLIENLRVRGKQSAVLELALHKNATDTSIEQEMKEQGMSKTHLYATQSILLQRCYDQVVPDRGFNLLVLLQSRGLSVHFKREFQAQERERIASKVGNEELAEFYLRTLHLLIGFTSRQFDLTLFTSIVELFRTTTSLPSKEKELCYQAGIVLRDVVALSVRPANIHQALKHKNVFDRLLAVEQLLRVQPVHLAQYHLAYSYSLYYGIIDRQTDELRKYMHQLEREISWLPEQIRNDEIPKFTLRKASLCFFEGQIDEAYSMYLSQYESQGIILFQRYGFHLDRFIRCALGTRNVALATVLINDGYAPFAATERSPLETSILIFRSELALLRSPTEATTYLTKARKLNTGTNYVLAFDGQMRLLDWIIQAKQGVAKEELERSALQNIKHFLRKGLSKHGDTTMKIFYAIRDLIGAKESNANALTLEFPEHPVIEYFLRSVLYVLK